MARTRGGQGGGQGGAIKESKVGISQVIAQVSVQVKVTAQDIAQDFAGETPQSGSAIFGRFAYHTCGDGAGPNPHFNLVPADRTRSGRGTQADRDLDALRVGC